MTVSARRRVRVTPLFDTLLAFSIGFLSAIQLFPLPLNVAVVDPAILILHLAVLGILLSNSEKVLDRKATSILVALWLILLASLLGTFSAQNTANSLVQVVRDMYAFAILLGLLVWLRHRPSAWRPLAYGLLGVALLCALLIFVVGGRRPAGTFSNPNYAGHYLAAVTIFLVVCRRALPRPSMLLIPVLIVGILGTASFGALSMLAAAGAYGLYGRTGRLAVGSRLLARLALGIVLILILLNASVLQALLTSDRAAAENLDAQRLDRTSSTRFEIWTAGLQQVPSHPFGVGPGAVRDEGLGAYDRELHSDPIAYLVERGALGLAGLVLLFLVLWRFTPRHGSARILLVALALGSLTRETLNYRHLWILLALALIFDESVLERDEAQDSDEVPAGLDKIAT